MKYSPKDVRTGLQVHQHLRLSCPRMEYSSSVPENLEDICIFRSNPANPGDEASIDVETTHSDVLLNTDRKPMQGADWLLVLSEIFVEIFGTSQGLFGKKFGDAVCLVLLAHISQVNLERDCVSIPASVPGQHVGGRRLWLKRRSICPRRAEEAVPRRWIR
jgi:hypothetical protein